MDEVGRRLLLDVALGKAVGGARLVDKERLSVEVEVIVPGAKRVEVKLCL